MTIAQVISDVSSEIKRGTSLDSKIPGWIARAAGWLERNYTYDHMWQTDRVTLATSAVLWPQPLRVKQWDYLRSVYVGSDGTEAYRELSPVAQRSVTAFGGTLNGWWRSGGYFRFDGSWTDPQTFEVRYAQYTLWPASTSESPELLSASPNSLIYQTLLIFATDAKDQRMAEMYKAMRDEALSTELRAQEALAQSGESFSMGMADVY